MYVYAPRKYIVRDITWCTNTRATVCVRVGTGEGGECVGAASVGQIAHYYTDNPENANALLATFVVLEKTATPEDVDERRIVRKPRTYALAHHTPAPTRTGRQFSTPLYSAAVALARAHPILQSYTEFYTTSSR